mmetsp:Transcript_78965/g.228256  ORF Transcript_78965/g.228256 Transcript_78965/m.228256 type:complete len:254 (-) Transcript_78965:364-1125(-)
MLSTWRPSCSARSSFNSRREASSCCSKFSRSCPMRSHSARSLEDSFSSKRQALSNRSSSSFSSFVSARSAATSFFSASMSASKCSTGCASSPRLAAAAPKKSSLRSLTSLPNSGLEPSLARLPKPGDPAMFNSESPRRGESSSPCACFFLWPFSFFDFLWPSSAATSPPKPPSPPKSAEVPQPPLSGSIVDSSVPAVVAGPKSPQEPAGAAVWPPPAPPGYKSSPVLAGLRERCESNNDRAEATDKARGEVDG